MLVLDFAHMVREFVVPLDGAEDLLPFDLLSARARLLPPLYAAAIDLPDADPEDDSVTRPVCPFDESRGVSPAMGSGFLAQQIRVMESMVSSFCATDRGWGIARWARFSQNATPWASSPSVST